MSSGIKASFGNICLPQNLSIDCERGVFHSCMNQRWRGHKRKALFDAYYHEGYFIVLMFCGTFEGFHNDMYI